MTLRRMMSILCLFMLISACKPKLEDIPTIIDIYNYSEPLRTAIVQELQPTPTFGIAHPIEDYFVLASSSNCETVFERVDGFDPVRSLVCRNNDVTVRFDEWWSSDTMVSFHKAILEDSDVTKNTTWNDDGKPEDPLGNFYEFIDRDGHANIIWTVENKDTLSLEHLSAWAVRPDSDQSALYEWWAETGSAHK